MNFFFFFIFPLLFILATSIKFNINIAANGQRCFKEYFPLNTHVVGEVSSTSSAIPNFMLQISDEKKYTILEKKLDPEAYLKEITILKETKKKIEAFMDFPDNQLEDLVISENKGDLNKLRFAFSTQIAGLTYVCINNTNSIENSFGFELSHGIDARDYSNIAKKQNLKPAETDILRIEDFVKEMKSTAESLWVKEFHKLELSESFNKNLIWVSLFGVFVIVIFGLFEYYVIKNYFKQKKLI